MPDVSDRAPGPVPDQPPATTSTPTPTRGARILAAIPAIVPWATAVVFTVALFVLWRLLRDMDPATVAAEMRARPPHVLAGAFAATAAGFGAVAAYDWAAARFFGVALPWTATAFGGASASAIANVVGNNMLSGGAVRLRFYARFGLSPAQVAGITVFATMGFAVAAHLVVAGAIAVAPRAFGNLVGIRPSVAAIVAALGVGASLSAFALAWTLRRRGSETRWRFEVAVAGRNVPVPSPRLVGLQLLFAGADLLCAALACWAVMPDLPVGFVTFLGLFVVATVAGMLSHVPGGFGVFEGILIAAFADSVPAEPLAAALLLYRIAYSFTPMATALVALFAVEARDTLGRAAVRRMGALGTDLVPGLAALAAVVAGSVLLVSGATPGTEGRLSLVARALPLQVLEAAHLAASLVGVLLLVLADGLRRRAHGAYVVTIALLVAGAGFSLAKGLEWEAAAVLLAAALALLPFRRAFHRPSALIEAPYRAGTVAAILGATIAVGIVSVLAHLDAPYAGEAWWQMAVDAEAPRSIRAALVAALVAFGLTVRELLRPARTPLASSTAAERDRAARIAAVAGRPEGGRAAAAGRTFLFHPAGDAFVACARGGRTLFALYGPIGPAARTADLIWAFRDLCDRHGLVPAVLGVRSVDVSPYVDAGLVPVAMDGSPNRHLMVPPGLDPLVALRDAAALDAGETPVAGASSGWPSDVRRW